LPSFPLLLRPGGDRLNVVGEVHEDGLSGPTT